MSTLAELHDNTKIHEILAVGVYNLWVAKLAWCSTYMIPHHVHIGSLLAYFCLNFILTSSLLGAKRKIPGKLGILALLEEGNG